MSDKPNSANQLPGHEEPAGQDLGGAALPSGADAAENRPSAEVGGGNDPESQEGEQNSREHDSATPHDPERAEGSAEPPGGTGSTEDGGEIEDVDGGEGLDEPATDAEVEDVEPLEYIREEVTEEDVQKQWYILKVQVNREDSIRDALLRRIKIAGYDEYFGEVIVPTEDVAEFTKSGKRRVVKRKLYPGYIMVNMAINDETWFLVRETAGIGDFTGSAGKPTPMDTRDIERILQSSKPDEEGGGQIKTTIPFRPGDRVRVKEGYFQNFEGDVESIDEANGRVTVMINIFGRSTPVELEHWQVESV